MAFVEAQLGPDVDPAGIVAFCRGKAASFKIPRHAFVRDALPMTASVKIRKVELRAQAKRLLLGEDAAGGR